MKLSNQAIGAVMMALQNSLLNQSDIVPILQEWELEAGTEGLVVKNPPTVSMPDTITFTNDGTGPTSTATDTGKTT